jgi:hypothetical protein
VWKHGTSEGNRAEEVHPEQRSRLGVGRLLERSYMGPTCAVDQHLDPVMLMEHVSHRRPDA